MKVTGNLIYSMVQVRKFGLMDLDTKEIMSTVRNSVKVPMSGLMAALTMGIGWTTESKGTALTHGSMEENTLDNGATTTCTDMAFTYGKTADAMKDTMNLTKSMGTGSMSGQMAASMRVIGLWENSTDKVGTF